MTRIMEKPESLTIENDFDVSYYTIHYRTTKYSPWLKPEGKIKPIKKTTWSRAFETFDLDPRYGNFNPKWPAASQEVDNIWQLCGEKGWRTKRFALRALKRVRELDDLGEYDYREFCGRKTQAVRHEFKMVMVDFRRTIITLKG